MRAQTLNRAVRQALPSAVLCLLLAQTGAAQPGAAEQLKWRSGIVLERDGADATPATAVALSPDGKQAVTGHENGSVRLWNALTGIELEVTRGHVGKVLGVRILPRGRAALSVAEREVRWWKLPDAASMDVKAWQPGNVYSLAISRDGTTTAAGVSGGKVLMHALDGKTKDVVLQAHDGLVMALAWGPGRKTLATGGSDGTVKVWDMQSRGAPIVLKRPVKAIVRALAFSPDGKMLASAHGREGVVLWDVRTGKERQLKMPSQTTTAVAFAPDGKTLVSGTANGAVRFWDVETGKSRGTFKEHAGLVHALTFAADGKALASVSFDGTVRLWRAYVPEAKETVEPKLTARELEILLRDLRGEDEARAIQAARALNTTPRQAVALLKVHMRPVLAADPQRVARLLGELDNPKFGVREKANKELEELGETVHSALAMAMQGGYPLEVQRRVGVLLQRLEKAESSPHLKFARRAVAVLERLATRESHRLLTTLAGGVPDAPLSRYARDALKRMDDQ